MAHSLDGLLDADSRSAYIYRSGRELERLLEPLRLEGEGPVTGFVLELESIFGLNFELVPIVKNVKF